MARWGDAETRFWSKVNKTEDCWEWLGCMEEDHAFHPEPTEMRKDVGDALGLETSDE